MVKTKFTYDEKSMYEFFCFHLKRKDNIRLIYYIVSFLFFISSVIIILFLKKYVFGLIILLASFIMFISFSKSASRAAKKAAKSRYKRAPQDIIFSGERIEQHLDKKILIYNWDLVIEVAETKQFMYFYISRNSALIVDKNCLTNNEYEELKQLIKDKTVKYYVYKK